MSDTSSEGNVKSKDKKRKLYLDDFEEEDEEETKHSKRRKHLGVRLLKLDLESMFLVEFNSRRSCR